MPTLDSYFVSLGIKGQAVVLSTMDNIRKKGEKLSKKKAEISLSAKAEKEKSQAPGKIPGMPDSPNAPESPKEPPKEDVEKKNGKAFMSAAKTMGNAAHNISQAASSLDPLSTGQSVVSALGTSLSGISVFGASLGRLPEGIAALTNATTSMAKNAVDMAKESTMAYHQLADRKSMTEQYGGGLQNAESPLSRNEMAGLIASVSGSMGRIQKPLADALTELIDKKDTGALARAGAGDWASTGTDKGWMLQQISNGMTGLPPTIKQKMQTSLLERYGGEIQDMTTEQGAAQKNAALVSNTSENQTQAMAASAAKNMPAVQDTTAILNSMQLQLIDTGLAFAGALTESVNELKKLPDTIKAMRKALDEIKVHPKNAGSVISEVWTHI